MTDQMSVDTAPATPDTGSQDAVPTAEQVEAEYKARLSGKDKAHAAETKALREQLAALQSAQQGAVAAADGSTTEAAALKQQLADMQKQIQQREQEYTATLRATQYPYAAEALDPQVLASMDEAKLAGLNARLEPAGRPTFGIDSSTPARTVSAPKTIEDMTLEEVREALKREAPAFEAEIRQENY